MDLKEEIFLLEKHRSELVNADLQDGEIDLDKIIKEYEKAIDKRRKELIRETVKNVRKN